MTAVSLKGISKEFHAGVTALDGIDLDVEPGEFVSLIGPSGCGKSTLLRIIGDLTKPTAGTVQVNGKPAERARRDHEYGIVFQDAVLYDWRTVTKNRGRDDGGARVAARAGGHVLQALHGVQGCVDGRRR